MGMWKKPNKWEPPTLFPCGDFKFPEVEPGLMPLDVLCPCIHLIQTYSALGFVLSKACKCKYSEVEYFIGQFLDYKCVNFKKACGSLLKDIFYLPALLYTQL